MRCSLPQIMVESFLHNIRNNIIISDTNKHNKYIVYYHLYENGLIVLQRQMRTGTTAI